LKRPTKKDDAQIHAILVAFAGVSLWTGPAHAQETTLACRCQRRSWKPSRRTPTRLSSRPLTRLARCRSMPGRVGAMPEITDAGTGHRESGIIVDMALGAQLDDTTLIDYDELDSLIDGLDTSASSMDGDLLARLPCGL